MKPIPFHFSFKGDRNYVQGADIYTAIIEQIEAQCHFGIRGPIKLSMHTIAFKDCDFVLVESGKLMDKPDRAVADCVAGLNEEKAAGWLIESDRPITSRTDFDEKRIEVRCQVRDESIMITGKTGYSSIEVAVSMTKQLHNAIFPNKSAKWMFTRLELARALIDTDSERLTIEHQHNFNNRLTRSEIFSFDKSIGHIYFSLVKL